ncbi:CDF family Co(II)/Ni(II) efflux transporter DmeF [Aeromonas media]|uniref:CDF family Co(II)/Ni(II) efflux transporter DmeF n=1 Tax=Aeromonas media TaxID=651 RepID=A0A7Z3CPV1_AERME|nr:CDF family Co(II)/Ni(II) efflux transporter DmeF [Aeromonas media]AHX63487.1 Co/Zn/Cd efflux system component [Aeromonas media WS]MBS4640008.1 CDF family Co(II)/Ni(II) efflux transporter DmeF [Aeromonas media]MCV3289106.1 CDF family Co(II)/Ni(II) efflux transporter DmeF [Aeromonas media]QHQ50073.1 CDF family Co(II)/Ni(II) efflux transporter DmeF [Aeromonas media]QJT32004.1 cation transporter [Aeromonas media]
MSSLASSHCQQPVVHEGNPLAEQKTRWAVLLTLIMMVAEIGGGWFYNSMALLADGWHMSSHALALGLSVVAYRAARHFARDHRFSFGTWKIEVLGGFSSALLLVGVAGLMLFESVARLLDPSPIHYQQAIGIAIGGLLVNLACAWLLKDDHGHHHGHGHHHDHHDHHDHHGHHHHGHQDLNLRAAYLHVLADAATSVLAIFALVGGMLWGADWLDPLMGIVGAVLVAVWARGLLRDTGRVLLDAEMDAPLVAEIREVIAELPDAEIRDLHVWRVGQVQYAAVLSLRMAVPIPAQAIRERLAIHEELVHLTIEIAQG